LDLLNGDSTLATCSTCGGEFVATRKITTTFTTVKAVDEGVIHEFKQAEMNRPVIMPILGRCPCARLETPNPN
jgi:hypothetical protein